MEVAETKTCSRCETNKLLSEFHKNKSRSDGRQGICKACRVIYVKQHYEDNKESYVKRSKVCFIRYKEWFADLKRGPCADCKERFHPCQMDFDHLQDKTMNVSDMRRRGFAKQTILTEVAKCELVCANCHRLRTYQQSKAGSTSLV